MHACIWCYVQMRYEYSVAQTERKGKEMQNGRVESCNREEVEIDTNQKPVFPHWALPGASWIEGDQ